MVSHPVWFGVCSSLYCRLHRPSSLRSLCAFGVHKDNGNEKGHPATLPIIVIIWASIVNFVNLEISTHCWRSISQLGCEVVRPLTLFYMCILLDHIMQLNSEQFQVMPVQIQKVYHWARLHDHKDSTNESNAIIRVTVPDAFPFTSVHLFDFLEFVSMRGKIQEHYMTENRPHYGADHMIVEMIWGLQKSDNGWMLYAHVIS